MKKLNEMNVKELSEVAQGLGLSLSYKADDGKRKRFNKPELIANIEYRQFELNYDKQDVQLTNEIAEKVEKVEEVSVNLNNVTTEVKKLLSIGDISKVKAIYAVIERKIKTERRNKMLVKNLSMKRNIVAVMIKNFNKKEGSSLV